MLLLLLLLLLLLHQGANQGFELLDAIANANGALSLRPRCVGAGEGDVLAYASLARKLAIASDSVDGRQSVLSFLWKAIFDRFTCDSYRNYMTTAVFHAGGLGDVLILLRRPSGQGVSVCK